MSTGSEAELAALRADHERLRLALGAASLGTWELRAPDDLWCDPASRALLRLPAHGALGLVDLLACAHPDDRGELERRLDATRAGDDGRIALRFRRLDEPARWLELHASAVEGRLVGTVGDVTAAEQRGARAEEERRINAILLRVGAAFASELQRERLVQVITDEATQLSGAQFGAYFENAVDDRGEVYMLYTLSGAPREAFSKFPPPRATALFGPTFAGEATVRIDDVLRDPRYGKNPPYHGMPAGHLPVRSYLAVPVRSRSGAVLGGLFFGHAQVGVFTTEHERLIEGLAAQAAVALDNAALYRALAESERQFRLLADAMPQIVWAARPDGALDYFNRRWYEFTGATEALAGDEGWMPMLHPDDRDPCLERWTHSVRTGEPYEIEYRFRDDRTGAHRWYLGRALPVRDAEGRIARWFGTCTDIHEQKEAIRARDVFLSIASHELRTPLTPLVLQLQGLARQLDRDPDAPISDRLRDKVARAERQVQRIAHLVDVLLDVTRLTDGRLEPTLDDVDLAALVVEVVERERPHLERTGRRVTLRADAPAVGRWDRFRLDQVVTNLLSNALKYGGERPVEVEVTGDERTVTLVVRDHGIGIALADQRRIFERFERAVSTEHYGGFGLGLWICRQVVEAFEGTIHVESAPGEGATFVVTLPRAGGS